MFIRALFDSALNKAKHVPNLKKPDHSGVSLTTTYLSVMQLLHHGASCIILGSQGENFLRLTTNYGTVLYSHQVTALQVLVCH